MNKIKLYILFLFVSNNGFSQQTITNNQYYLFDYFYNPSLSGGESNPKKDEIDSINHGDSKFKKLFRKAAVKCHPDKHISSEYSEKMKVSYELLTLANDTYDWGLL